jgi:hypothetical protein
MEFTAFLLEEYLLTANGEIIANLQLTVEHLNNSKHNFVILVTYQDNDVSDYL